MTNGGDAAEQVVRLSLEGFEVAAKLSGAAAKNIAVLLVSVLKQEQKTKGKNKKKRQIKSSASYRRITESRWYIPFQLDGRQPQKALCVCQDT